MLSEDVARFVPTYPDGVTHFNLPGYVMYRLEKAGISDIDLIDIDTYTDDDFYSYRRDPNNPGRQYTFIELKNE